MNRGVAVAAFLQARESGELSFRERPRADREPLAVRRFQAQKPHDRADHVARARRHVALRQEPQRR